MKIKSIIVALGLIITMISGVKSNYFNNTANEAENSNTVIAVEENIVEEESIISENEQVETEQEQIVNNDIENKENAQESLEQEVQKETAKSTNSQDNKTTKKTETVSQPTTQETTPKQVNTSVAETPKKEEPVPQPVTENLTQDDLEYWCVAGGTHHIAGDGANEHGYYSSWDEANQAFINYTKGWTSDQHKIDTCSCGLYYFWAIQ